MRRETSNVQRPGRVINVALSLCQRLPPLPLKATEPFHCSRRGGGPNGDIRTRERPLTEAASLLRKMQQLRHRQEALGSIYLRRTEALFSAKAARMRALNATSSIFSPS